MNCTQCKKSAATGIESKTGKCWFCTFPRNPLELTPEQRAFVESKWPKKEEDG